jgi:hypothetical protein
MPDPKPIRRTSLLAAAWRPAGAIYLVACLAGLAAGLWPDALYPPRDSFRGAPLPALQTLAVAQAAFILLAYPLVLFRRLRAEIAGEAGGLSANGRASRANLAAPGFWLHAVVESAVLLALTSAFYLPAAWLADGVCDDVLRSALGTACLFPVAWAAGWWMGTRPGKTAVLLILLLAAFGLPAGWYAACEFFLQAEGRVEWIWHLAPGTFAWDNAASRLPGIVPEPLWSLVVWPAAASASALAGVVLFRRTPR